MQRAEGDLVARQQGPTVALVEWNWMGHHPHVYAIFATALADIGATVAPWLPRPADLTEYLATSAGARPIEANRRILPAEAMPRMSSLNVLPHGVGRRLNQLRRFRLLGRALRAWERRTGRRIDLVFFSCMYEWDFDFAGRVASHLLGYDWSGLYLQAGSVHAGRPARATRMFSDSRMRAIAVLEPSAIAPLQSAAHAKPVVLFPEVVDVGLPTDDEEAAGLARKIRRFAAGRKIVSLVGFLKQSKGLEAFTLAARDPRLSHLFFFIGGELSISSMPSEAALTLLRNWESAPNLFAHPIRISSEKAFNAIVVASDVIFAAYLDFPYSSNIVARAAGLGRPLIASSGFLMGDLVDRYDLGITVPQGDVEAIVQALLRLTGSDQGHGPSAAVHQPEDSTKRREFQRLHSYESLCEAFRDVLTAAACIGKGPRSVAE